jgi:1,4-dihydroxy-2-naphthoate octaprenyltransferase
VSIKPYIQAARLRTLPLAIAGILTGNLIAGIQFKQMHWACFILSLMTAIALQILSNYANDYGDFKNGADTEIRTDRVMASGQMSIKTMQIAIGVLIALSLVSGIGLLITSIQSINSAFWSLMGIGCLGIAAAYFYTAGKYPYGYYGLGDLSVYIFFGIVAVLGSYYLQSAQLSWPIVCLAHAMASISVAVLNINNIRDIETDALKQKHTLATQMGHKNALRYQLVLLTNALLGMIVFLLLQNALGLWTIFGLLINAFILIKQWQKLKTCQNRMDYNHALKTMSISALIMMLCLCLTYYLMQM